MPPVLCTFSTSLAGVIRPGKKVSKVMAYQLEQFSREVVKMTPQFHCPLFIVKRSFKPLCK